MIKLGVVLGVAGVLLMPALSYAQASESAVTTTIGYFYSAPGQMIDAEDNNGVMSSYLTRGERYNGTSETFAVSNIKDITADLDSNDNVLNKYTYTAYGTQTSYSPNTQITTSTTPQLSLSVNPFTYDGYYTDSESGNYYLNARYYDPVLGIFFTSDSYNLPNRYMYVNGNPVRGIDPTGHTEFSIETKTTKKRFLGCFFKYKSTRYEVIRHEVQKNYIASSHWFKKAANKKVESLQHDLNLKKGAYLGIDEYNLGSGTYGKAIRFWNEENQQYWVKKEYFNN